MTDSPIAIRRGTAADATALASFAARTFIDAYAPYNSREQLDAQLTAAVGVAHQVAKLTNRDMITVIAESAAVLVGQSQVRRGPVPRCVTVDRAVEVQRFYVDRSANGTGVSQLLMTAALHAARDLGGANAWLEVWENTPGDRGRGTARPRHRGTC